ncbi:HdeD family acid-resistance protein [Rhodococcus wratislaviensis]|uniref:HdeD family acid-resistance protein n=1 Tax=Rhodococcus wratislaviensis TaxID=44752 RepID=UPI003662A363
MATRIPTLPQYTDTLRSMLCARGLLATLFGVVAVGWPAVTVHAVAVGFGLYSILDGLTLLVGATRVLDAWGECWIAAATIAVAAGTVTLLWPDITALTVLYLLAISAILAGTVGAVGAFRLETASSGRPGRLVTAFLLLVLLGILLLLAPGEGIMAIVRLLGAYAVLFGTTLTVGAIRIRRTRDTYLG